MSDNNRVETLRQALRQCWTAETSSDPELWSAENPAWGQCAVTACIVQDALGGEVVWATATTPDGKRHSHYFNRLVDGTSVDLTREQFPTPTEFAPPDGGPRTAGSTGSSFATTREYVLSFPATQKRYTLLRARVERASGTDQV